MEFLNENKEDLNMEHQKNKIILQFLNIIFKNGKKSVIEKKINIVLSNIKLNTKQKPLFFLSKLVELLLIHIYIKKIPTRKQINIYQLKLLSSKQQLFLIFKWILQLVSLKQIDTELFKIMQYKSKIFDMKKKYFIFIRQNKFNIKK